MRMRSKPLAVFAFSLCFGCAAIAQQGSGSTATPATAWSPSQNIGLFAFPKNNQSADQQLKDEAECYGAARQRTGVDAQVAPPQGLSDEEKSGPNQAAANAPQVRGVRVAGAGRGAAGGAAIGAIAGNAGKGAAIGAVAVPCKAGRPSDPQMPSRSSRPPPKKLPPRRRRRRKCYGSTRRG